MSQVRCLITAGPTREYFDPVRYITNPSSGKMGYALASAAVEAGWTVDLVSGPVSIEPPKGVTLHKVVTSQDMLATVEALFPHANVLLKCAAVCDMRPAKRASQKVKKDALSMTVEFEPTPDILKTISLHRTAGLVLVGFAAETEAVEAHARKKLVEKRLDYIAANQVGGAANAFESDDNTITLIAATGESMQLGPAPKREVARQLISALMLRHQALSL